MLVSLDDTQMHLEFDSRNFGSSIVTLVAFKETTQGVDLQN